MNLTPAQRAELQDRLAQLTRQINSLRDRLERLEATKPRPTTTRRTTR